MNMIICPVCNAENKDTYRFCPVCGSKIAVDLPQSPEVIQPEAETAADTVTVREEPKYIPTYADKSSVAGFTLSVIGVLFFIALPFQLIGLFYCFGGLSSKKRGTLASVGLGLCFFGILCFTVTAYLIFQNYSQIINSELFAQLYYSFFG